MQEVSNYPHTSAQLTDLRTLTHGQLLEALHELGQPAFRCKQIESWVWEKGVSSFDQMTNLPKALRQAHYGKIIPKRAAGGGILQQGASPEHHHPRPRYLRKQDRG